MATTEIITHSTEPANKPAAFSIGYTGVLLANANRISQSDPKFQNSVLHYLALNFADQLDRNTIRESINGATQLALVVLRNKALHTPTVVIGEENEVHQEEQVRGIIEWYSNILIHRLDGGEDLQVDELGNMAKLTMQLDYKYLRLDGDRSGRRRAPVAKVTPFSDPFLSFWAYHGLMGKTTGMPEYDAMFADMVTDFTQVRGYDAGYQARSAALLEFQLEHHPDQQAMML